MIFLRLPLLFMFVGVFVACSENSEDKSKQKSKSHLVEISKVVRSDLAINHVRTGTLRARREVKIFNQEEGTVIYLPFFEGDTVKKGQVIARLDDELLVAQLARAQATLKKAKLDFQRISRLVKRKLASAEELARIETEMEVAKADEKVLTTRISHSKITATIDGVVTQRLSQPGNVAERYTHLLTIADPESLITEVNVSGLIITNFKVSDTVYVRIDALGDKLFESQITRIHPTLDPITRQGTVEVELKPVPNGAVPGQLCRVSFSTTIRQRLSIPFRSLRRDKSVEYVIKINDDNTSQYVPVTSGQRVGEVVEILEGLTEGESVVIKGFLGLKQGKKVKVVGAHNTQSKVTN